MKLFTRIFLSLSITLIILLSVWTIVFYYQIMEEVNDETDDALEEYGGRLIEQSLVDTSLLKITGDGSNNNYFFTKISPQYAHENAHIFYYDTVIYISSKMEDEPARVLTRIFKTQSSDYYQLTVITPTIEKDDLKQALLIYIVILYALLLITIIVVNVWVYIYNLKPLHKTLKWLSHNEIGKKNEPLTTDIKTTEFQLLNEEINKYVSRTERAYNEQKNFISSASHELQTPIAICQNRLDILLNHTELTEEQMGEILKTQHTLSYMSKLNKTLLFLSKIYNNQFPTKEKVSFAQLIKNTLPDYEEAYAYKNISTQLSINEDFIFEMNDALATSLITNLIKNSFVHNRTDGKILIELNQNSYIVRNTGKTDTPLDKTKIFEQYFHSKGSEESTGLGLTITTAITKLYGFELEYIFINGFHEFRIVK